MVFLVERFGGRWAVFSKRERHRPLVEMVFSSKNRAEAAKEMIQEVYEMGRKDGSVSVNQRSNP